jgi:hypothetical protein
VRAAHVSGVWNSFESLAVAHKDVGVQEGSLGFQSLNYLAVVAAAISAFVIGGLWYSPLLLGGAWKKANGFVDPPAAGPKVFGLALLLSLVMAVNLAMFLNDPKTTLAFGAMAGFLAGFGWAAMGIGIVSLFERRSLSYVLINGGYLTVALTMMGVILGAWR